MAWNRIVLIGHSGSGKTSMAQAMGSKIALADMDRALGVAFSPPWNLALDWMLENPETVMAISVHMNMLRDLGVEKQKGIDARFEKIFFLYLHKSKEALAVSLQLPKADGTPRDEAIGGLR